GVDTADLHASILAREPDWSTLPPTTPSVVGALLRRCLEKDRRRRIGDVAAVLFVLDEVGTMAAPRGHGNSPVGRDQRAHPLIGAGVAWTLAAMLLVAVAGLSVLYLHREPAIGQPVQLMVVPPDNGLFVDDGTSAGTPMMQFALSPDGRLLAFIAATADGRPRLWVRPLEASAARSLPDTDGASQPFWSPDSRFIGFS